MPETKQITDWHMIQHDNQIVSWKRFDKRLVMYIKTVFCLFPAQRQAKARTEPISWKRVDGRKQKRRLDAMIIHKSLEKDHEQKAKEQRAEFMLR